MLVAHDPGLARQFGTFVLAATADAINDYVHDPSDEPQLGYIDEELELAAFLHAGAGPSAPPWPRPEALATVGRLAEHDDDAANRAQTLAYCATIITGADTALGKRLAAEALRKQSPHHDRDAGSARVDGGETAQLDSA